MVDKLIVQNRYVSSVEQSVLGRDSVKNVISIPKEGELMKTVRTSLILASVLWLSACGKGGTSYSLLEDGQTFRQNSGTQDAKIDVLWVIDNSGSMATSQKNLTDNFSAFIDKFTTKGLDFQIAVTSTQAYLALPVWTTYYNTSPMPIYYEGQAQNWIAKFRDGAPGVHSGQFILTPQTANIMDVFKMNATQGTNGRGDERSLQSMRTALESPHNQGFLRQGSYLAVILVTDEDDFSHDGTQMYERYDRPLHTIDSYVQFLDGITGSSAGKRRYTVNTISVNTQTCLDSIYNGAQKIGLRVGEMADATGGVKGDICGDFAKELGLISDSIVKLSTQFSLGDRKPIPETIKVYVNGELIPNVSSNPANNGGWYYEEATNTIFFQGNYTPPQGAVINVTFDPRELTI